jgi:hypothetical protein
MIEKFISLYPTIFIEKSNLIPLTQPLWGAAYQDFKLLALCHLDE